MIIRTNRTVRIRIVSGGMEHRTLESLKAHFSIADLKDPLKDGRLVSWLETIGEKEMAEKVSGFKRDLENKEGVKEFCRLFDVPFNSDTDIYYENFSILCEEYQSSDDKDAAEWREKFIKCREFNKDNEAVCGLVDLQIAKLSIDLQEKEPKPSSKKITVNGVKFNMILVEGDGSLPDYYIGETTVTNELWYAIMNETRTRASYCVKVSMQREPDDEEKQYPVVNVSWDDCNTFIDKLNQLSGLMFSLPTSYQWGYVAKGGNKSQGYKYSGSDYIAEVGWNRGRIHSVAELSPNELGIYDMTGNVWEWCVDEGWTDKRSSPRIIRGGGYSTTAERCEIENARDCEPKKRVSPNIGLRLCLNI